MRTVLEAGLVVAILVAVGGFGGTEPVSWGIAQALVLSLGFLLAATSPKIARASHRKALLIPIVLTAWVAIQWIGSRHGKIGIDAYAIESQGLAFVTAIAAFYVALDVSSKLESRARLAASLVALGLLEAVYGLVQYLAGWQYIWNVPRRFYIGSATGTYINHNHFAGLLEMILPLALGLAFHHCQLSRRRIFRRTPRHRSARDILGEFGHPEMLKGMLLLLAATVLFVAILFSLSRMGTISILVSLCFIAAVASAGKLRSGFPTLLVLVLLATGAATAAWVGIGPVLEHFEQLPGNEALGQGSEGRVALWKDTLKLIGNHPWTGVGLGCFEYAFTRVQSIRLTYIADHAHNDFLELTAELGIPAAILLIATLLWLCGKILRAILRACSGLSRTLALGSLGGISALLVHGMADFNLYIPANALVFAVLLGTGYAATRDECISDPGRSSSRDQDAEYRRDAIPTPVEIQALGKACEEVRVLRSD